MRYTDVIGYPSVIHDLRVGTLDILKTVSVVIAYLQALVVYLF